MPIYSENTVKSSCLPHPLAPIFRLLFLLRNGWLDGLKCKSGHFHTQKLRAAKPSNLEQGNAESGNKVVAIVDGDKLFCKVYRTNGEAYLEPKNGEGKIPASRFNSIGVIVGVFREED